MKRASAAAALLIAAGAVLAQPAGYAERYAATCAACHGAQGASTQPLTPSLGGQPSFYAITQLFLFRDGRRESAAMTAVAKGMSDDDLRGYSEAIARLPPPPPATPTDPASAQRGAALVQRFHCAACHGADLDGAQQVPRLAGQRKDYLLLALEGFSGGTRIGYQPAMSDALVGVTARDMEDLANFLASCRTTPP